MTFSEHAGRSLQASNARSTVFCTTNPDEAACRLSASAVPYRSELLSPVSAFSTRIESIQARRIQLSRVNTTGVMRVQALLPEEFYAVVVGVSGQLEHRVNGKAIVVEPDTAFCQSPLLDVEVRTPEQFEVLFVRLRREDLVCELEKRLLRQVHSPLTLSPDFALTTEAGQMFRRLAFDLCRVVNRPAVDARQGIGQCEARRDTPGTTSVGDLEQQLVSLLLEAQRHNYTRLLSKSQDAGPWHVRAAEEYMSAHAGQALSLGDICAAAGVNSRTLQYSFRRKRGCTPMQFLRDLRLERVRGNLSQPDPATTVTSAASRWAFFHFGRFAAQYQARFGERPSETLERSRK